MSSFKTRYLIIGNSAGGIGAVEAIRSVDKTGALMVVSDEPYPAYSRPMISDYLAGHATLEKMLYRPACFYDNNGVTALLGKRISKVALREHAAWLDTGDLIAWEKLLLATGGTPIVTQVQGLPKDRMFSFTTLDDARAIDRFLKGRGHGTTAVVVGGGLIGFSVSEALVSRGVNVTIVEMRDRVLNTIIDEVTSSMAQEALEKAGVKVIVNHTVVRAFTANEEFAGVALDNEEKLACDFVVMAIGVRPRVDLITGTEIKVNRGILVDRRMMTSVSDVYACGDVAEAYDFVFGLNRLSPIWPNAYMGGRVAGMNMAGIETEYRGGTAMNSLKYFGLALASAGITVPPDASYEVVSSRTDHINRRIVIKDGVIQGMVMCGDVDKSGIVVGLMRDRVNVESFKGTLVSPEFSLACLPEAVWRERLGLVPPGFAETRLQEQAEEEPGGD